VKNRLLERIHPTELQEARAVAEARPLPPRKPFRAAYTGVAADVLPELLADTSWSALGMRRPATPRPIALTDWSARIADDWTHINRRWDNARDALVRAIVRDTEADEYEVQVATAPLLAAIVDLTAVVMPQWRKALDGHAADELAWIDAEMAVAL
jgi:hypothetical protein